MIKDFKIVITLIVHDHVKNNKLKFSATSFILQD